MPTCEYRHPLRSIWFEFVQENEVLRIVEYTERDALLAESPCTADVTVIATNDTIVHAYPVDSDDTQRRTYEYDRFVRDANSKNARVAILMSGAEYEGIHWSTMLSTPSNSHCYTELESLLAVAKLEEPALYVGRVGNWWWIVEVDTDLRHVQCYPHPEGEQPVEVAERLVSDFLNNAEIATKNLVVFGDSVSPQLLISLQKLTTGTFDSVERFQPFRLLRSSLDQPTAQRVLARAHLVGLAVGAMLLHAQLQPVPSVQLFE